MNNQQCLSGACGCNQGDTLCDARCVNTTSDTAHCGGCGKACQTGYFCTAGTCLRSPCDGLCEMPEAMPLTTDGYRVEPLGTFSRCLEVKSYQPTQTNRRIVCWEFQGNRSLRVNGVTTQCARDDGAALPDPRAGGFCVQVSSGGATYAGVLLPTR
jgi:hypothetical protein